MEAFVSSLEWISLELEGVQAEVNRTHREKDEAAKRYNDALGRRNHLQSLKESMTALVKVYKPDADNS